MGYSTNGIVYEAIQRTFRNAVVSLIRERLVEKYGASAEKRVANTFPSWEEIKSAAARSSATAVVRHSHDDDFAYLDVSHFTALFNDEFPALVTVDGLPPDVAADMKRQMLGYLREIKTVRDPMSHPGDTDLEPYDALRVIDSALRVLRLLGMGDTAETLGEMRAEVAALAAAAPTSAPASGPVPDGLPPRDVVVVDFVGRQAELARLWEWVADTRGRRWLLTGDGGKGKSAIAYQFATEIVHHPETNFDTVQWLSAKRRRFSEGEVLSVAAPEFWDLDSAVNRLLTEFGWSEHVSKPIEAKRLLLCQLVKELACFVVVDDIDALDEAQEDAVEFLASDLPTAGAKVLLTSRRSILGMGTTSTKIVGLDDAEAELFIRSRLDLFSIDPSRMNARARRRIIEVCEGSPLYMEDLLRLCTFLPVSQALESWRSHAGAGVRRYALERELELLSRSARHVLEASCVAGVPVTVLELQHLLGQAEDSVLDALTELRRHHLVAAPELVEEIPRFSVNANLRLLVLAQLEGTERRRKLDAAVVAVTGGDLIGRASRAVEDYRRQAEVLLRSGHFEKAEQTLKNGLEAHPNHPQLYSSLATVFYRWKPQRAADARTAWMRAFELGSRTRRMYYSWARLEEQQEDWQAMLQVAERGLERTGEEDPTLLQIAGYAASRLGQSLQSSFNTTRATEEFARSDDFLNSALRAGKSQGIERHFISKTYRSWIINAHVQRKDSEICRRLEHWLAWDPSDATALEEAERQRTRCARVEAFLKALPSTGE